MMYLPNVFGENLFDDMFRDFDSAFPFEKDSRTGISKGSVMKTDVKESDEGFTLEIDLPGYKKEDVKAELHDGYLTITASNTKSNEEKDDNGKYIRKERYCGSCSRSFYVGKDVKQTDIKGKYQDGILNLFVPKIVKEKIDNNGLISIEG